MAELDTEQDEVVVRLTRLEKLGAFSGDVHVPRSAVRDVGIVLRPFAELRGLRIPGTYWPGRIALGTWRRRGERLDFVAIHRGQQGIVVELDERSPRYGRLLVSVDDAEQTRRTLRSA